MNPFGLNHVPFWYGLELFDWMMIWFGTWMTCYDLKNWIIIIMWAELNHSIMLNMFGIGIELWITYCSSKSCYELVKTPSMSYYVYSMSNLGIKFTPNE